MRREVVDAAIATVRDACDRFDHRGAGAHDPSREPLPERIVIDEIDRLAAEVNRLVRSPGGLHHFSQVLDIAEREKARADKAEAAIARIEALIEGNYALDFSGAQIIEALRPAPAEPAYPSCEHDERCSWSACGCPCHEGQRR